MNLRDTLLSKYFSVSEKHPFTNTKNSMNFVLFALMTSASFANANGKKHKKFVSIYFHIKILDARIK